MGHPARMFEITSTCLSFFFLLIFLLLFDFTRYIREHVKITDDLRKGTPKGEPRGVLAAKVVCLGNVCAGKVLK